MTIGFLKLITPLVDFPQTFFVNIPVRLHALEPSLLQSAGVPTSLQSIFQLKSIFNQISVIAQPLVSVNEDIIFVNFFQCEFFFTKIWHN